MAAGCTYAVQGLGSAEYGPAITVQGDEGEADHRDDETVGTVVVVGYGPHQLGQDRPAHDAHNDIGGGAFRPCAQAENAEGKDGREHNGHEEVAQEYAYDGEPAQLEEDQETAGHIQHAIQGHDLVGGEFPQQGRTRDSAQQEAYKAKRGQVGCALVANTQHAVVESQLLRIGVGQQQAVETSQVLLLRTRQEQLFGLLLQGDAAEPFRGEQVLIED